MPKAELFDFLKKEFPKVIELIVQLKSLLAVSRAYVQTP